MWKSNTHLYVIVENVIVDLLLLLLFKLGMLRNIVRSITKVLLILNLSIKC